MQVPVQEPLLGPSAERAYFARCFVPGFGASMMRMRIERQREPHVSVGEKHLPCPRCQRCARPSGVNCLDVWNEPRETRRAFSSCAAAIWAKCHRRRSPPCRPATPVHLSEAPPRYGLVRGLPSFSMASWKQSSAENPKACRVNCSRIAQATVLIADRLGYRQAELRTSAGYADWRAPAVLWIGGATLVPRGGGCNG